MSDNAPESQNDNGAGPESPAEDWQARLEAQKKINRDLERKTKTDLKRLESLEAELAQLREGSAPKDEVAATVEKAKKEAVAQAQAVANQRIVAAEVKAAAAATFADPADAVAFLDLADFEVSDNLEVDGEAIKSALADLLKRKPHLAAKPSSPWGGGADQGPRGNDVPADTSPRGLIYAGLKTGTARSK